MLVSPALSQTPGNLTGCRPIIGRFQIVQHPASVIVAGRMVVMRAILILSLVMFVVPTMAAEIRVAYVAFPTMSDPALWEAGKLTLPPSMDGKRVPAVVIVHGSAGVDSRGGSYAETLAKQDIATLEIDMWAARGTRRGAQARPKSVAETIPDAYGALRFLASQPEIDPARIGIMGFSWGGVVTMLSATRHYADPYGAQGLVFKAQAAFYPACWIYNQLEGYPFRDLTAAPVLIQAGDSDDYDETSEPCTNLVASLPLQDRDHVKLILYPGAGHGFDRLGEPIHAMDPFSHRGKGGAMTMIYQPSAAAAARDEVGRFFARTLGVEADSKPAPIGAK
jgi:dienelactone hydrolase